MAAGCRKESNQRLGRLKIAWFYGPTHPPPSVCKHGRYQLSTEAYNHETISSSLSGEVGLLSVALGPLFFLAETVPVVELISGN